MKRLFLGTVFLASLLILPGLSQAQVSINIGIALPPAIWFERPPRMVVLPQTDIYVTPDVSADIFFVDGWWWRPWHGRWYRSHEYNRGWQHYDRVPSFYRHVPRGWRKDYVERRWHGYRWDAQPIRQRDLQKHWQEWKRDRYREKPQSRGGRDGYRRSNMRSERNAMPGYQRQDDRRYNKYDGDDRYRENGRQGRH